MQMQVTARKHPLRILCCAAALLLAVCRPCVAQTATAPPRINPDQACARGAQGSTVPEPQDLRSQNGVLKVELKFRAVPGENGQVRYCYITKDGVQAPNLRLHPGDELILLLKNEAPPLKGPSSQPMNHPMSEPEPHSGKQRKANAVDPCLGGAMTAATTNLHFHGLVIPPVCHQDETLKTLIQPADPAFEYRFRIPLDTPPGLYWYHPHPHGFSKAQVLGGASGALIVEGIEQASALVAGLPERVLIVRDQDLVNSDAAPVQTDSMPAPIVLRDAEGDAINTGTGGGKPAKDLSLNFVPVPYPEYPPAVIKMKPSEKQFWRVLNASAITYLDLQVLFNGTPQLLGVVALDGVPIDENGDLAHSALWKTHILMPPAGRAEIIVKGPAEGVQASLVTRTVDTGPAGENDPTRPLATIVASREAPETHSRLPLISQPVASRSAAD